ncbi:MAG: hypothetical protein FJX60_16310 [Alphaproteobacteria bacterium]|nr:hypothetical protein [Alphaproteobacteria bacterium]
MIAEALEWLVTPCPLYVRRLGLLAESIAISARHRRCRRAWAPHLAATRQAILEAVARTPRRRTALIMGSGALHDVPIAELADAFERVLLVDLVHPWPARLRTRHLPQVTLVTDDVTGTLEAVARGEIVPARPFAPLSDPEVDLAVSLNLLSQIPSVPVRRLEGRVADSTLASAVQRLVNAHLSDLGLSRAATLLISDVERVVTDRDGLEIERTSLIAELPEPQADRSWWWDIAPAPEIDTRSSERRRVIARFVPSASGTESL